MAKKGMKRPQITPKPPKNSQPPVPEIQGKAKHTKAPANPIIAGTEGPSLKVYHFKVLNMDNEWVPFYSTDTEIKVTDSMDNRINPDFLGWSTIEGGQVEYQSGDSINVSVRMYNRLL